MREAQFVKQNKEKWLDFEKNLKEKMVAYPDKLATQYNELTNDLSYAQTFYPGSKTTEYLNEMAIYAHQSIYKDRRSNKKEFIEFFKTDVPLAVYRIRKQIFYSLLIFIGSITIGWFSSAYDQGFVRLILGDYYVDMTIENIKRGDPAAVYSQGGEVGSFLAITINNMKVALYAFVLGIFLSVGTGYILAFNGIMVGTFMHLFYKYDVFLKAMSAVFIHGTIELSMIVIAGGCGLAMGNSFLFPKTFRRIDAFMKATKNALYVLLGTLPFFLIAGFLEGFVTRHYNVHWGLSFIIIGISAYVVWFYFIYWPKKVAKSEVWN